MNTNLKEITFNQEGMSNYCYPLLQHFKRLTPEELYLRFNSSLTIDAVKDRLKKFYIDPNYEHTFHVALNEEGDIVCVAQLSINPETHVGEFSISVLHSYQRQGLGIMMVKKLLELAKEKGCRRVECSINLENTPSRALVQELGAKVSYQEDYGMYSAVFNV